MSVNDLEESFKSHLLQILQVILKDWERETVITALDEFISLFTITKLKKDQNWITIGTKGTHLGYLITGLIRAYHLTADGNEYTKTIFMEGDFVAPLASLTTGTPSPVSLQALTPVELTTAQYVDIEKIYRKHHCLESMARKLIQHEWVKKEIREINLVTLSAEKRYDLFLEEYRGLEERIPWYHIASFLGITPVALSRIRKRKKDISES
jgi:CRP-like cAMP-binding protein